MSYAPISEYTDNEHDRSSDIPLRPLDLGHDNPTRSSTESRRRHHAEDEDEDSGPEEDEEAIALIGSGTARGRDRDQEKEGDERLSISQEDFELDAAIDIVKKVSLTPYRARCVRHQDQNRGSPLQNLHRFAPSRSFVSPLTPALLSLFPSTPLRNQL